MPKECCSEPMPYPEVRAALAASLEGRPAICVVTFGVCMMSANPERPLSFPILTGLAGRCPRCGEGKLFRGFLQLRRRCDSCGLDYGFADPGDGPAVFAIFIGGFIVVAAALIVEFAYQPPYWLHAALWAPLILIVTLGPLRLLKGLLIALQYHHKAAEGRLHPGEET